MQINTDVALIGTFTRPFGLCVPDDRALRSHIDMVKRGMSA